MLDGSPVINNIIGFQLINNFVNTITDQEYNCLPISCFTLIFFQFICLDVFHLHFSNIHFPANTLHYVM